MYLLIVFLLKFWSVWRRWIKLRPMYLLTLILYLHFLLPLWLGLLVPRDFRKRFKRNRYWTFCNGQLVFFDCLCLERIKEGVVGINAAIWRRNVTCTGTTLEGWEFQVSGVLWSICVTNATGIVGGLEYNANSIIKFFITIFFLVLIHVFFVRNLLVQINNIPSVMLYQKLLVFTQYLVFDKNLHISEILDYLFDA